VAGTFVVDASVVVEFLAPGQWGQPADRLIGGLAWPTPLDLFAPDVIFLEVANALRKLSLAKLVSDRRADRLVEHLPELAIATVGSAPLLRTAWSYRKRMTLYDASYVALARALDCPLVTTDTPLARACASFGIPAHRVDDPELAITLDALEAAAR
jgi:predicted nucleic acid-binding protein